MLQRSDQMSCFVPTFAKRLELASRWGGFSLAWSVAVQDGIEYFGNERGLIAFGRKWGYVYALGDPLCCPNDLPGLVAAFVENFPNASFVQIHSTTAEVLQRRRWYINEMGIDTTIDLGTYDFRGKEKERLRYASNWLTRRGYSIVEHHDVAEVKRATEMISDNWRQSRIVGSREVCFLNRPLNVEREWHQHSVARQMNPDCVVRRFYLVDSRQHPVAFVFFDPIFEDGRTVGYVTSFKRRLDSAPAYAEMGITKAAIEVFQCENRSRLLLGLSPLAEIENRQFRKNWFLHHSFRWLFKSGLFNRWIYNLQGHYEFKQRFRGTSEKVHFASPTIINDIRLIGLLRLCRAI